MPLWLPFPELLTHTTSAAEEVAKTAPGAKVVKAFNTTFAALMRSPSRTFDSQKATGFYCGDDSSAKAIVSGLIKETGLEPFRRWTSDVRQIS
ncbi:Uncharacterised protein [uncultured archaeon]|nr:Uncharacterised protein [uncultured archaeon]